MDRRGIDRKLKILIHSHEGNISSAARSIGVSKVYLWDVIKGNRKAGKKLIAALEGR